MKERRGRRAARRCFVSIFTFRPLVRPPATAPRARPANEFRPPNGARPRHSPLTDSPAQVRARGTPLLLPPFRVPTEEEHLGIREKGDGGRRTRTDGSEGGGGRICHARREESGRGSPSPGQTPKRTPGGDGPGRGRSVRPWALCPTKRPSRFRRPISDVLSKRTLFQLTDGSVAVKTTTSETAATMVWPRQTWD